MKTKILLTLILFICFVFTAYSEEGFGDIFGDSGSSEEESKTAESGGIDIEVSGFVTGSGDWYLYDEAAEQDSLLQMSGELTTIFKGGDAEAEIRMYIPPAVSFNSLALDDIIDTAVIRAFFSFMQVDIGMQKIEWGKGDGFHVIDPLNPLDQSRGIESDLNRMKRSELMAVASFFPAANTKIELVYKPFFHPHETATQGRWMIIDPSLFPVAPEPDPDTETAEYSQLAARFTISVSFLDLGVLYYYGYMNEPAYRYEVVFLGGDPMDPANYETTISKAFTRAQLFGVEAAAALGPFTLRTELGFWLSEDTDGDIDYLYNNRFCWLGGFDFTIPGTQIFVSIQEAGQLVLGFDDLSSPYDVDLGAAPGGFAHTNMLLAALEGSFFKDKLKLRLSGMYVFESSSFVIMPAVFYYPNDSIEVTLSVSVIDGEESVSNPYYAWSENDTISLAVKYTF